MTLERGPLKRAAAVALWALVSLAFGASAGHGFINWDDGRNLYSNPHILNFGARELGWAWTTFHLGVYQPLGWILLGIEWRLSGGHPAGLHLTSMALHGLNAVVLWRLGAAVLAAALPGLDRGRQAAAAWLAAAAFSIHPLRTEAVAWASCQPYLPSILFFMLSLLAHLAAHGSDVPGVRKIRAQIACFVFFVVAVLFKAIAVSLPAALLVLDGFPLGRLGGPRGWFGSKARRVWLEKAPHAMVMIGVMVLAVRAKAEAHALVPLAREGWLSRLAQSCYSLWFYLAKTAFPWPLSNYYFVEGEIALGRPIFLVAVCATLGAVAWLAIPAHRPRWLAAAAAGYLVMLAPNMGLVQVGEQVAADRYSYLPSLPWVVCLTGAIFRIARAEPLRKRLAAASAVGLLTLVLLSRRQTSTWRDSVSLWSHALAHGGARNANVHNNLGAAFDDEGASADALAHYREAYRWDPRSPTVNANIGASLIAMGQHQEALSYLQAAVRLEPENAAAHFALGSALVGVGQIDEARRELRWALALRPDDADALTNLAVAEVGYGNDREGESLLARALALNPDHVAANMNLGVLRFKQGDARGAIAHYQRVLRVSPGFHEARRLLESAKSAESRTPEPEKALDQRLRTNKL